MKKQKIGIVSFFSGIGLLDLGFELNGGYSILFVNEYHKPFLRGYQYSRAQMHLPEPVFGYSSESIEYFASVEGGQFLDSILVKAKKIYDKVGFIGGPPCPDFSIGGKNKGRYGDNGKLSRTYIDLILKHQPDFFLFENVKGLWRTKKHRAFYDELKNELSEIYSVGDRLCNAIEFGVAQDRDRIIMHGYHREVNSEFGDSWPQIIKYDKSILDSVNWPDRDNFVEGGENVTPDIERYLTVEHWFRQNEVDSHPNANHHFQPRAGLPRFQTIDEGDVSRKSYKRLHRWRFSPTAAYGNNEVHLHPYRARRMSAAEALAVQSAPSQFELPGDMTLTDMFKSIGNGVPYLMAKGLANLILINLDATTPKLNENGQNNSEQYSARNQPTT